MRVHEEWAEVIIVQGMSFRIFQCIAETQKVIVCDIYDPFHLEQLEQARDLGEKLRKDTVLGASYVLNQQLTRGDFFLCASDKQRDFWLGQLAAVGRINPANYDASPDLSKLIQLAPFGVSDDPPRQLRRGSKEWYPASPTTTRSSCGAEASTTGSIRHPHRAMGILAVVSIPR